MACGVAWIMGEAMLSRRGLNITLSQAVDILTEVFLAFGAMVAVACLHILQRGHYGWKGTLLSLVAFLGLLVKFNGQVVNFIQTVPERPGPPLMQFFYSVDFEGQLLASVGLVGLGVVTIAGRVLPWWRGVALIAGSPFFMFVGWIMLEQLFWLFLPTMPVVAHRVPWMLLAVPWILVGYAIFRAGAYLSEQTSLGK